MLCECKGIDTQDGNRAHTVGCPSGLYRVGVHGVGERTLTYNGLTFATAQQADAWGYGLLGRWSGARDYVVEPVPVAVATA